MRISGIAARLRAIQANNDWTVQEMADLTGLPKRSLENYMRKENPQLPGVEALVKIAHGLGVSLDWLVLGEDSHSVTTGRLVRLSARAAVLPYLQSISVVFQSPTIRDVAFEDGKVLGMMPEELAMEIATEAGKRAEALATLPARSETLRVAELALDQQGGQSRFDVEEDSESES